MKINKIVETSLYCDNVPEMVQFYKNLFGFPILFDLSERGAFLRCGENILIIFNRKLTIVEGQKVPNHGSSGPGHIAFEVDNGGTADWKKRLEKKKVSIEQEKVWEHSGATSLYFRDPANNSIEITEKRHWDK